jgi:hypothetical protein
MKRTLTLCAAAALVLLSGCQSFDLESLKPMNEPEDYVGRGEKITNVVGNVWRIEATGTYDRTATQLADHLNEEARRFCDSKGWGMLPGQGSTTDGSRDEKRPTTGWLEFTCQAPIDYRPEYKGITKEVDIDELTDLTGSKKKKKSADEQ